MAATGTQVDAGKPSRMLEVLRECGALPSAARDRIE